MSRLKFTMIAAFYVFLLVAGNYLLDNYKTLEPTVKHLAIAMLVVFIMACIIVDVLQLTDDTIRYDIDF